MALVTTARQGLFDDRLFGGFYGYSGSVVAYPTYQSAGTGSANPFHKKEQTYTGTVGIPNPSRPVLRPENDRLDKLVSYALVKIENSIEQLKQLADACDDARKRMAASDTGGSKELRTQLASANKEIYRLRTLLTQEGGAGDLETLPAGQVDDSQDLNRHLVEQEDEEAAEFVQEEDGNHAARQLEPRPGGDREFAFLGLMVTDGIKFREEYGGKHEYGAAKVVKVWGPSAFAGIAPMDFITHINGAQVSSLADFNRVVSQLQPETDVEVLVERNNRQLTFIVSTENTAIVPGTITHHNIVHAHLSTDEDGSKQYRIEANPRPALQPAPSREQQRGAEDSQTLHL